MTKSKRLATWPSAKITAYKGMAVASHEKPHLTVTNDGS